MCKAVGNWFHCEADKRDEGDGRNFRLLGDIEGNRASSRKIGVSTKKAEDNLHSDESKEETVSV